MAKITVSTETTHKESKINVPQTATSPIENKPKESIVGNVWSDVKVGAKQGLGFGNAYANITQNAAGLAAVGGVAIGVFSAMKYFNSKVKSNQQTVGKKQSNDAAQSSQQFKPK